MIGEHRDPRPCGADQFAEPAFQLDGGQPVKAQDQNLLRRDPQDVDQEGHAMHDHPRLARAGTGQDQGVLVGGGRDDGLLLRMLQIVDDPLVRLVA